jgi:hypothetical protein
VSLVGFPVAIHIPEHCDSARDQFPVLPTGVDEGHDYIAVFGNIDVSGSTVGFGYDKGTKPRWKGEATVVGVTRG